MAFPSITIESIDRIGSKRKLNQLLDQQKFEAPSITWRRFTSIHDNFYQLQLLQTRFVELELTRVFNSAKKKILRRLKNYKKIGIKTRKHFINLDFDKYIINDYFENGTSGLKTIYERHRFPNSAFVKLSEGEGAGMNFLFFTPDAIQVITTIDDDPFRKVLKSNFNKSYHWGGQQAFHEFNIRAKFELRDLGIEQYAENYNNLLSSKVTRTISDRIKSELIEGIRLGEGIPELSARVSSVYSRGIDVVVSPKLDSVGNVVRAGYTRHLTNDFWSKMVARTETIRWSAEGRLNGYQQTGVVQKVIWQATGDNRTCPDCLAMEGRIMTIVEASGLIPLHCLGRCTWVPTLCGMAKSLNVYLVKLTGNDLLKAVASCQTSEMKKTAQKNVERQNTKITRKELSEDYALGFKNSPPQMKVLLESLYRGGTLDDMVTHFKSFSDKNYPRNWQNMKSNAIKALFKDNMKIITQYGYEFGVDINGIYTWYGRRLRIERIKPSKRIIKPKDVVRQTTTERLGIRFDEKIKRIENKIKAGKKLSDLEKIRLQRYKIMRDVERRPYATQMTRNEFFKLKRELGSDLDPKELFEAYKTIGRSLSEKELLIEKDFLIDKIIGRSKIDVKTIKEIRNILREYPLRVLNSFQSHKLEINFLKLEGKDAGGYYNSKISINLTPINKRFSVKSTVRHELGHALDDLCGNVAENYGITNVSLVGEKIIRKSAGVFSDIELERFYNVLKKGYEDKLSFGYYRYKVKSFEIHKGTFLDPYDGRIYLDGKKLQIRLQYFANNTSRFLGESKAFFEKDFDVWKAFAKLFTE